ncbi:MAG: cupin domain-containing protein [Actinomycetota bacterium]|nr:cupin domain-containing protein [Actinomycetota bacterium]
MANVEVRSFDSPDETRPFQGKGQIEVMKVGGREIAKATFEPGWRWSENVKPIAETDSCQFAHFGYVLSGRMRIVMDDGGEAEAGPGDVVSIPPGHDAEVLGDEACVMVDVGEGAPDAEYAKSS